jgi:hypothetical protein
MFLTLIDDDEDDDDGEWCGRRMDDGVVAEMSLLTRSGWRRRTALLDWENKRPNGTRR